MFRWSTDLLVKVGMTDRCIGMHRLALMDDDMNFCWEL